MGYIYPTVLGGHTRQAPGWDWPDEEQSLQVLKPRLTPPRNGWLWG